MSPAEKGQRGGNGKERDSGKPRCIEPELYLLIDSGRLGQQYEYEQEEIDVPWPDNQVPGIAIKAETDEYHDKHDEGHQYRGPSLAREKQQQQPNPRLKEGHSKNGQSDQSRKQGWFFGKCVEWLDKPGKQIQKERRVELVDPCPQIDAGHHDLQSIESVGREKHRQQNGEHIHIGVGLKAQQVL